MRSAAPCRLFLVLSLLAPTLAHAQIEVTPDRTWVDQAPEAAWMKAFEPHRYALDTPPAPLVPDGKGLEAGPRALQHQGGGGQSSLPFYTVVQRALLPVDGLARDRWPVFSLAVAVLAAEKEAGQYAFYRWPLLNGRLEGASGGGGGIAGLRDRLKTGEWKIPNDLNDARLNGGVGAACRNPAGIAVRYGAAVAIFLCESGNVTPADRERYTTLLAQAWVDRVATPQAALRIEAGDIVLATGAAEPLMTREPAADQQSVLVTVHNTGSAPSGAAELRLYCALPGEAARACSVPVELPAIAPGGSARACAVWELGGRNVAGATLYAVAAPPGVVVTDLTGAGSVKVSIAYAAHDGRAFRWADDTYAFANFGATERELEEQVEGLLATLTGSLQLPADQTKLWERLAFAETYTALKEYLDKSRDLGVGGHCYGMSATAALYFQDAALKPLAKPVPQYSLGEASPNINLYHRAQMLPLLQAAVEGQRFQPRDYGVPACLNAVRSALTGPREAPVIEFFGHARDAAGKPTGPWIGHAVLAYKLIEVEGRDAVVYVYDPNFPPGKVPAPQAMPQIALKLDKGTWSNPRYMGYDWAAAEYISAHPVWRRIPVELANNVYLPLKQAVDATVGRLYAAGQWLVAVRCPAEAVIVDEQGRRTGTVDGRVVNEIPGAEVVCSGEVELYRLPAGHAYRLQVTATERGRMALDIVRPSSPTQAELTSFTDVPLERGVPVIAEVPQDGRLGQLAAGAVAIKPAVAGGAAPPPPAQAEGELFTDSFSRPDPAAFTRRWTEHRRRVDLQGQVTMADTDTPWQVAEGELRYSALGDGVYNEDFVLSTQAFPVEDVRIQWEMRATVQTREGYCGPGVFLMDPDGLERDLGWSVWYSWENASSRGFRLDLHSKPAVTDVPVAGVNTGEWARHALVLRGGSLIYEPPGGQPVTAKLVEPFPRGARRHLAFAVRLYDTGVRQEVRVRNVKVSALAP